MVKNLAANAGDAGDVYMISQLGRSPGGGMAIHSSFLAGSVPWTEEPGELQSVGSQRAGYH